jgi:hypothetical protein
VGCYDPLSNCGGLSRVFKVRVNAPPQLASRDIKYFHFINNRIEGECKVIKPLSSE